MFGEKIGAQVQVDKARPGHLCAFDDGIARERVGNLLRQLARILLGLLGRAHHAVDLVVAEIGVFGRLEYDGRIGDACGGKGGGGFALDSLV